MAAASVAGKPAPRKRAPRKTTAKPPAAAAAPAEVPPAPPVDDGRSINQWLNDLKAVPLRIEVFDQWWEFKLPTGGNAARWDVILEAEGIREALAFMMHDQTPSPDRSLTDASGAVHVVKGTPGSAAADRFIAAANDWVSPVAAAEFWRRMERAIFGPGEASAS